MRVLRDTGFFRKDAIDVNGSSVVPLDMTAKLLFPAWEMQDGEEDLSIMRVIISGEKDGLRETHTFDLLDRFDQATGITSMARTTGYTCAVAARLVADGRYQKPGISPPEYLGTEQSAFDAIMEGLHARGIIFSHSMTPG
jgi:saccharopine dehydrogenase-like NADP-dependent oxidoreductase